LLEKVEAFLEKEKLLVEILSHMDPKENIVRQNLFMNYKIIKNF
jgi:hypothetical protein